MDELEAWAQKFSLTEADPLWGAVLAARKAEAGASTAQEMLEAVRREVAKVPAAAESAPRILAAIEAVRDEMARAVPEAREAARQWRQATQALGWGDDKERYERAQEIAKVVERAVVRRQVWDETGKDIKFWALVACAVVLPLVGGFVEYKAVEPRLAPAHILQVKGHRDCGHTPQYGYVCKIAKPEP